MCTSGIITDATSGREIWFKNCRQNAFVEKYPSGDKKKIVRYVKDIYWISFSHMKRIDRCINTNLTYSWHVIKNHNRICNRISYTML